VMIIIIVFVTGLDIVSAQIRKVLVCPR